MHKKKSMAKTIKTCPSLEQVFRSLRQKLPELISEKKFSMRLLCYEAAKINKHQQE